MSRQHRSMLGTFVTALVAAVHVGAVHVAAEDPSSSAREAGVERRISLQTAKTSITDAFRLIAEQGGLNLVIGPGVEGEVTLYLEDVPVTAALKAIARNNGFVYSVENDVIAVSKPPEMDGERVPLLTTRIFNLQWQDAERVRDALEFALSRFGKIKVLNENSRPGYGVQRLSDLAGDLGENRTAGGVAAARSQTRGRVTGPGGILTDVERPRHARTLVVTDVESNLGRIADLIADLDKLPRQVLIEARIVEMSTDLQRQLGIDWDVNVLANGPILNHELPLNWRAGFSGGAEIRHSPDGTVRTSVGLDLGTIDFSRLLVLFRAHQTDNAIRLLANPRLLVHNNHSASILVGERYPILQATITDFGTVTEAFDTYIPVGVQLEVTPTIMMDGRVSMLVHPATSALGDDVIGTTGLRVARIRTREMDTRVIINDGQTIVLGGLISDRKTRTVQKVPGLGDWPILSLFFRQENPRSERVDLLIFLTVHVDAASVISERDQQIFDTYRPHFKHVEHVQDVPLHFEIPTEYRDPKPMFGDPPLPDADEESPESDPPDVVASVELGFVNTEFEPTPSQADERRSRRPDRLRGYVWTAPEMDSEPRRDRQQMAALPEPPLFAPVFKAVGQDLNRHQTAKIRRTLRREAISAAQHEGVP